MEIDELFIQVTDLLTEVPELKWIDMDFGQMESDQRPPVTYPCALVAIDLPEIREIGQGVQKPRVLINVKLCFNYEGETSTRTAPAVKSRALAYYGAVKEVYKKLQGKRLGTGTLKRRSQIETAHPLRIKMVDLVFETEYVDQSART